MSKSETVVGVWIGAALTVLAAAAVREEFWGGGARAGLPRFDTPFEAVLLDNGQVYYGKLTGLGTPYPKMTDVYYVVNAEDPTTKKVKHVLVKRGNELHAPTETFLSSRHIIMVENVGTSSEIAKLIQQAQSGAAPAAPAGPAASAPAPVGQ
jgi:hypothetical protein